MGLQLVEVKDDSGNSFLVEIETTESRGNRRLAGKPASASQPIANLEAQAEGLRSLVRQLGTHISQTLNDLNVDKAEMEVGIKLGGEAGNSWFLAKATGEANMRLKIIFSPMGD